MEISTRHQGDGVHLLAYLPDPTDPDLADELRRIRDGRGSRVPAMIERLRGQGSAITLDDVRRANPTTTATGRPHVADALVALGEVADRDEAFEQFLARGPVGVRRPLRRAAGDDDRPGRRGRRGRR